MFLNRDLPSNEVNGWALYVEEVNNELFCISHLIGCNIIVLNQMEK